MKPKIPKEMKDGFSKRLIKALDEHQFPKAGRVARLSEKYGVTPSAASAWLKGSLPTVDMIVKICDDFGMSPNYLLTGRDNASFEIDHQRLSAAVKVVNHHARKARLLDHVEDGKLAALYEIVYQRLLDGNPMRENELMAQLTLAAPEEEI